MKVNQLSLLENNWQEGIDSITLNANLILLFIAPEFSAKTFVLRALNLKFPNAIITGCSTAGEISNITVKDNSISLTAIQLEKTKLKKVAFKIQDKNCSEKAGEDIAEELLSADLQHLLVLSDGLNVNGAELVNGLKKKAPNVTITGGLAADGFLFNNTFVVNQDTAEDKIIIGLGFYGTSLKVGCSSKGGWESFGIERLVTKSEKNVLFELDGKPALQVYKAFLGPEAVNLPSSGLLFPLSLKVTDSSIPVVRTILGVSEENQSLTFAGNIPYGAHVRLMKANMNKLITGAKTSAVVASANTKKNSELAILISCVGRRLVLKQMVEEEIEVVRDVLSTKPTITGFYSYGEIGPFGEFSPCELHNQTMTITILSEC